MSEYKDDIISLRKQGKSYREIEKQLGCSRGTISYHCKKADLNDIGMKNGKVPESVREKIRSYYEDHTKAETAKKFDVSESTVSKHAGKRIKKTTSNSEPLFSSSCESNISHNHVCGHVAEQKISTEALKRGYIVSKPVVESRYDLLFDNGNEIKRIQAKYSGNFENGSCEIDLTSECRNNGYKKGYTAEEVDAIIAYIAEKDVFVRFMPNIFENQDTVTIRFDEPANGQQKNVNAFEDYRW